MAFEPGETLYADVDGEEREVELVKETAADGLLLVTDGDTKYTVGKGEVTARDFADHYMSEDDS